MAQATVLETPDITLDGLLATPAGRALLSCIQCGTCAGTCPYGDVMRNTPRRLIGLLRGKVRAIVSKLRVVATPVLQTDANFNIKTPTAIAGVKGTDLIVYYERGVTGVIFIEGEGFVYNPSKPGRVVNLRGGQVSFVLSADEAPQDAQPVSESFIAPHLKDMPGSALETVVPTPLAGGSPGRALNMDREEVTKVKDALSSAFSPSLNQRLQVAREIAHQEGRGRIFLEILEGWLRDLIVYQETGEEGMLLNRDLADKVKRVAPHHKSEGLLRDFWSLLQTQRGIDAHGNLQLALESALLGIGGL